MSDERKSWKEEDVDSIQRCPHDEENPYAQISNELIRDQNISPNCRWLIIYLLSNKGNWRIKIAQVVNHLKGHIGKDKVYKIVDEAIYAGYMMREQYTYKNLKRYRYFVSEKAKFKKCYRYPDFQDIESSDPENQDSKEEHPKKDNLKKEYSKSSSSEEIPISPSKIDDACGADDDLENKEITYMKTNGQQANLTQTQIFKHFLTKPFPTEVIKNAIRRFRFVSNPVNNALKYLESICEQIQKELNSKTTKKEQKPIKSERPVKIKEETINFEEYCKCQNKPNPFRLEKS